MSATLLSKPLDEIISEKRAKSQRQAQAKARKNAPVAPRGRAPVARGGAGAGRRGGGRGGGAPLMSRGAVAVRGGGGGRARQPVQARRGVPAKPYQRPPRGNPDEKWTHDLYTEGPSQPKRINTRGGLGGASDAPRGGTAVFKGLDFDLTEGELKKVVSEYGVPEKVVIKYDKAGRPTGEALVVFSRAREAQETAEDLDDAEINGHRISVSYQPGGARQGGAPSVVKRIDTRPVAPPRPRGSTASVGLFARSTKGILSR